VSILTHTYTPLLKLLSAFIVAPKCISCCYHHRIITSFQVLYFLSHSQAALSPPISTPNLKPTRIECALGVDATNSLDLPPATRTLKLCYPCAQHAPPRSCDFGCLQDPLAHLELDTPLQPDPLELHLPGITLVVLMVFLVLVVAPSKR